MQSPHTEVFVSQVLEPYFTHPPGFGYRMGEKQSATYPAMPTRMYEHQSPSLSSSEPHVTPACRQPCEVDPLPTEVQESQPLVPYPIEPLTHMQHA